MENLEYIVFQLTENYLADETSGFLKYAEKVREVGEEYEQDTTNLMHECFHFFLEKCEHNFENFQKFLKRG